ncbi:alpha/beta hydrolase [Arthrobacter zhangbolii]|uniref:Alpha/beta hydrolase n=1 Tax=Arthrobacter zhangbolii TaxID=2886936 RepID=A0A9X1S7Y0_9MICC|nr:alpha/beta hydrolase [Arthrobacter zhangbolii]MCC3271975.1 alpha/beta hydrolase [Arthrobacter zhangbolii]UON92141.1 alpha/beta hydrolase [Arthrobacter zhangbolii]
MSAPPRRIAYGPGPEQYAELTLPSGGSPSRGTVVIIHGGYWRAPYTAELGSPLARDLADRGFACWNLEYRRAGNGGGWPVTFSDIRAGIDALADAAGSFDIDLSTITLLGHSAGGHLAVLAAAQAGSRVAVSGVVSQSGVLNLAEAHELGLSDGAVQNFLGCSPEEDPQRYREADPMFALPLHVPAWVLHGEDDTTVPFTQSAGWAEAAAAAGGRVHLRRIPGDHFAMITPGTPAWDAVVRAVGEAAGITGT